MIRKYHNHKLQTTPWHREEEPLNHHETPGRQIKQSNQLSLRTITLITPLFGIVHFKTNYNYRLSNHCFINELILVTNALISNAVEKMSLRLCDKTKKKPSSQEKNNRQGHAYNQLCFINCFMNRVTE